MYTLINFSYALDNFCQISSLDLYNYFIFVLNYDTCGGLRIACKPKALIEHEISILYLYTHSTKLFHNLSFDLEIAFVIEVIIVHHTQIDWLKLNHAVH